MEAPTRETTKKPTKRVSPSKVDIRRKKILCCLLSGLSPHQIMEKYSIKRHTFYNDFEKLNIEKGIPDYKEWTASDIAKHSLKTKSLILQAMGYSQKDIGEIFGYHRSVIMELAKYKPDKNLHGYGAMLIKTKEPIREKNGGVALPGIYHLCLAISSPDIEVLIGPTDNPDDVDKCYLVRPDQLLYNHTMIDAVYIDGTYLEWQREE